MAVKIRSTTITRKIDFTTAEVVDRPTSSEPRPVAKPSWHPTAVITSPNITLLIKPGDDVAKHQRVQGGAEIAAPGEARARDAEKSPADHAHEVGPGGQARHHQDHGQKFRRDQKMHRLERHRFERVNLFIHLHGADFRGKCGAGPANHHDRRHQRA